MAHAVDPEAVASALGYVVGAGSLALYSPILLRVCRSGDASGLTLSTWWLKLTSYTCSDVYSFANGYPLSTYLETLIITVEAALVLAVVGAYQRRIDAAFAGSAVALVAASAWALTVAPPAAIALAQGSATILNTGALLPQLHQNWRRREAGGYSPVTASLACAGCTIRLFTTVELADSDPLLLAGFGCGLALNAALLAQIVWFGAVVGQRPLLAVLSADFVDAAATAPSASVASLAATAEDLRGVVVPTATGESPQEEATRERAADEAR